MTKSSTRQINFCLLLFSCIFIVFFQSYKIYKKKYRLPDASIVGYVSRSDGIGRQSLELIAALKDTFDIHYKNTRDIHYKDVPKNLKAILENRKRPFGKVVIFEDTLSIKEDLFKKMPQGFDKDRIKIAYSMFEATKIPPLFVERINHNFDAVIVPDPCFVDIYKNCGVVKPIFVLPLGLDLSAFLSQPLKKSCHHPMTFGCFASCELRKNLIGLIRAFDKAFHDVKDVHLIIHCRRSQILAKKALLEEIDRLGLSQVTFQEEDLDADSYLELFKKLDVYVSLSKGEGYSIPPREAMALGLPVILTDNLAQSTLCQSGFVTTVPSKKIEPAVFDALNLTIGHYFDHDIEDAAYALKKVYHNYRMLLNHSEQARSYVQKFDYSHLTPYYKTIVKPKNIKLGHENKITLDTLETTSETLYYKYKKLFNHL